MAPINDAARAGDVEALRRELERGISPDTLDYGMTPLVTAANMERADCVSLLLRAGADPNFSRDGFSALIMAACNGSPEIVCMLLEAGADVDAKGEMSETPLHVALTQRNILAVKILLSAGANPNLICDFGDTPRQRAETMHSEFQSAFY